MLGIRLTQPLPASLNSVWLPADLGLLAWTYDIATGLTTTASTSSGLLQLSRIKVPATISAANIVMNVATAGVALTAGQCFAGLYTTAGVRLAATADQATAWGTTGLKTMPISGGPISVAAGTYYVGWLFNGTSVGFSRLGAISAVTTNAAAVIPRGGAADSGATSLPAVSVAPVAASIWVWAGLS